MDTMRHTPAGTFQNPNVSHFADYLEETNYVNECNVDKVPYTSEKKCSYVNHLLIMITVSWGILLLIMVPRIYLTFLLSEKTAKLTTEKQQLSSKNKDLQEKIAKLEEFSVSGILSIIDEYCSLPKLGTDSSPLFEVNAWLMIENQRLSSKNLELQARMRRLEDTIAEREEFNVSRAESIIKDYCPIPEHGGERRCAVCMAGWKNDESSCYAFHDANPDERRSWEDAEKDCRAKGSHLAVIDDDTEKWFIMVNSWGQDGFWIGLRVEDDGWKWADGTTLSHSSWIEAPQEGHCAASFNNGALQAVACSDKKQWICEKKALSL